MTKPMVFNYADHERALEEIKKLKENIANLQIRCRIAESDRNCEQCKHHKADGCSRWECEYEPVMSDLIKKSDAIKALYKYNFVSKNVIEREINAIPSADAVEVVRCKDCRHSRIEGDATLFMWCGYWNKPTDGNRYCSDGERREP